MDRTNWKWGNTNINILMLGIVYQGIAIPIACTFLDKQGNSNTQERIDLMNSFISRFGKSGILGLLADREFIGKEWMGWLEEQEIPFCIRVKSNFICTDANGETTNLSHCFSDLSPRESRVLSGKKLLLEQEVHVVGLKMENEELLILATNQQPETALERYKKRWEIETLFQALKGRGFYLEDTHMTNPQRIEKLLAILSMAFAWAHKTGEWKHQKKTYRCQKTRATFLEFISSRTGYAYSCPS